MEPTGFRATKFIVLFALFSYSVSASTFPQGFPLLPTLPITRDTSLFPYREMTSHYMDDSSASLGWYMIHELRDTKKELAHLKTLLADATAGLSSAEENINDLTTQLAATNATLTLNLAAAKSDLATTKSNLATTNANLGNVTSGLAATKSDLATTKSNLATTNANLGNVTSDLSAVKIDLGKTKDNLAKTNSTLTEGLAVTNGNLANTKSDLVTANITLGNVKSDLGGVQAIVNAPPIYFYVQKNESFFQGNVSIPFEIEILNVGKAMDLSSGIFTAPRAGVYYFSFSGLVPESSISLFVGNIPIASAFGLMNPSLQSTIQLRAGDEVSLQFTFGEIGLIILDPTVYQFHFTGFFLHN